jgi:hypothetical protein
MHAGSISSVARRKTSLTPKQAALQISRDLDATHCAQRRLAVF